MDSFNSHDIIAAEEETYQLSLRATTNLYANFIEEFELQDDDESSVEDDDGAFELQYDEECGLPDDEDDDRGRAAVIEFPHGKKAQITNFGKSSEALREYFRHPANELNPQLDGRKTPCRRLFLLEDVGLSKVKTLGSQLRIPPAFFVAHWTDPISGVSAVDQDAYSHCHSKYFKLKVPQLHRLSRDWKKNYHKGVYKASDCSVQRYLQLLDKDRAFENSLHQVSFWSTGNDENAENKSWTSVLLVDPVFCEAKSGEGHRIVLHHPDTGGKRIPTSCFISMDPLPSDHLEWKNVTQKPCNMSMFDNMLSIYTHLDDHGVTKDPRTSTAACRRLSLIMWRAFLGFREREYYRFKKQMSFGKPLDKWHSWFHSWDTSWRAEAFHGLLYQQAASGILSTGIEDAMRLLGVGAKNTVVDDREAEDWIQVSNRIVSLKERLANLINGYTQEASIQESKTSNYQARSVGRLTSLATILVPFSVTAALFSMGGDFSAGQSLFWVFWVIAVPIAAFLFFGILILERRELKKTEPNLRNDRNGIA